ncbi:hypothetical protein [Microbispora sp. H11081]|uniref:hypothetical protein n=1 Tax=Microbispora sp. H11081 TaxID=2729107 RepID=UPI00147464E1|nr:hypothetical protein [Microbispora sp. H11081]
MGIVGKACAISGGALAIALAGVPLGASPAQALDCTGGDGLLSGITGGVCSLVGGVGQVTDGVTDVADKATGGLTEPVTKVVDDTLETTTGAAGTAVHDVGKTVDKAGQTLTGGVDTAVGAASGAAGTATEAVTGKPAVTQSPVPSVRKLTDGLTRAVQGTCLPLVAGEKCASQVQRESGEDKDKAGDAPAAGKKPARKTSMTPDGALRREPYRPRLVSAREDAPQPRHRSTVDPDEDGLIPLLWPGQKLPELRELREWRNGSGAAHTRASRSSDAAGTALTAALLLSALLATRVVSARRARGGQQEPRESIPLEGGLRLPGRSGRHRLA